MKKNFFLLLASICVALTFGLVACSDNSTEIPTYPAEKGTFEINGVSYTSVLNQCPPGGIDATLKTPMMKWNFLVLAPNNGVQSVNLQCNAMGTAATGFENPTDGQHLEDMNFQLDVATPGPIFPRRLTYVYRSGTVICKDVNVEKGTMSLEFNNLTVGFTDKNTGEEENFTFNGTVPFNFTFPAK